MIQIGEPEMLQLVPGLGAPLRHSSYQRETNGRLEVFSLSTLTQATPAITIGKSLLNARAR